MVSRVNFLETTPRVEEGTGGTMRAVERYEVVFFDVAS